MSEKGEKFKMRKLNTIQKRENLNAVYAVDKKGNGGANHRYQILSQPDKQNPEQFIDVIIQFQNGARSEWGSISGVIDTDLLEIVRDRLKGFQDGKFATEYNAKALEYIELALMYMNRRVEDRIERGVLGLNKE